jgi:phosphate starvation-inducible PhoH-like protein
MPEELVTMNQQLENPNEAIALFGNNDVHLKRIEEALNVSIVTRGEAVFVSGDSEHVNLVDELLKSLLLIIRKGISISERDVIYAISMAREKKLDQFENLYVQEIAKTAKGKSIRVKTLGQRHYIAAIQNKDLDLLVLEKHI